MLEWKELTRGWRTNDLPPPPPQLNIITTGSEVDGCEVSVSLGLPACIASQRGTSAPKISKPTTDRVSSSLCCCCFY